MHFYRPMYFAFLFIAQLIHANHYYPRRIASKQFMHPLGIPYGDAPPVFLPETTMHAVTSMIESSKSLNSTSQLQVEALLVSIAHSSHYLKLLFDKSVKLSSSDRPLAWFTAAHMVSRKDLQLNLTSHQKSLFIKKAVVLRDYDALQLLSRSFLFSPPLPSSFSLENTMRIFLEIDPLLCLDIFKPYMSKLSGSSNRTPVPVPTSKCFSYAITASSIIKSKGTPMLISSADLYLDSRQDVVEMLAAAASVGQLSVGLVSTALTACRASGSWRGSIEVLNFVKRSIPKSSLDSSKDFTGSAATRFDFFEDGKIPTIIYGQCLANLAQNGAENSVYQLVCEMLENEASFTGTTIDYVFFEIAKGGSYNVLIKLRDLLLRHGVKISSQANNAVLNACDKAGAYSAALGYYFFKMPLSDIDYLGLSVLLKACDRTGSPKLATIVVMHGLQLKGVKLNIEIYQRLFAIYLKSNRLSLAISFLVYLEELKAGLLTFTGIRVQSSELCMIVDEWHREIVAGGPVEFSNMSKDMLKKYSTSKESWLDVDISEIDLQSNLDALCTLSSCPDEFSSLYSAVLSLLAINRFPEESLKLFRTFRARGGSTSTAMFTSVIYSQKFAVNYRQAEVTLEELRLAAIAIPSKASVSKQKPAVRVTIAPFNALLAVYSAKNAPQERKNMVFQDITNLNLTWDKFTYTAAIMNEHNKSQVIDLWRRLSMTKSVDPSYVFIIKSLTAALFCKDGDTALNIIELLWGRLEARMAAQRLSPEGIQRSLSIRELCPDANENRIYTLALLALYRSARSDDCFTLLTKIRERGHEPTQLMYSIVMKALKDQGDWQRSITVLLQIALRTKYIDAGLLENVLLACIKSKEFGVIIKLIEELPKLTGSFVPTQFMLTQYTYAAFKLRDTERAYQSLEKMREYNHLPGSISIAEVISLLESTGETERSVDIFQTYIAEHIFPSEKEVALLVDLHGYSQVIARAAVRSALRLLLNNADAIVQRPSTPSLILITGIGKNSKENMEPILKPSIKAFLESLNPALPAKEVEDNPGRLVVSPDDVDNWIKKQKPKSAKSYNH